MYNHIGWIKAVFNSGRQAEQVFGTKHNNSNGLLFSLLGLGIGAVAYNAIKASENRFPKAGVMKHNQPSSPGPLSPVAVMEFAEELMDEHPDMEEFKDFS